MNFETYLKESARTETKKYFIENMEMDLLHAIVGLNTEAVELLISTTKENDLEEIGDLFWYLAIIYRKFNFKFSGFNFLGDVSINDATAAKISIVQCASDLLNLTKKTIFYGSHQKNYKDIPTFHAMIISILQNINQILNIYDVSYKSILQENIDKLYKRYPEKFTAEHAEKRLDKDAK